jgi:hypothetical protein
MVTRKCLTVTLYVYFYCLSCFVLLTADDKTYIANNSVNDLAEDFGECMLSLELWPARSPDFNPCDLCTCDTVKDKCYVNNPRSLQELKEKFRQKISIIPEHNATICLECFLFNLQGPHRSRRPALQELVL